jgi:hypothetical protein
MSEVERLKQALALTCEHNMKITEENQRLRERAGLPGLPNPPPVPPSPPAPRKDPLIVKVHPDLVPPPPPPPPVVKPAAHRSPASGSIPKKRARTLLYGGDKPLRTQWPLDDP